MRQGTTDLSLGDITSECIKDNSITQLWMWEEYLYSGNESLLQLYTG